MTLKFAYPTEVSRPYMPDPQQLFEAMRTNLEDVGIKVEVVTSSWNGGYLDNVTAGKYDAYLLGWTGDYDAAFNFIGTFFGNLKENDFGTEVMPWGKQLADDLQAADAIVDEARACHRLRDDQPADHGGVPARSADQPLAAGPRRRVRTSKAWSRAR